MSRAHWGEGKPYLRGSIWWIRYPDGNGNQRRESLGKRCKTLYEAERELHKRLRDVEKGDLPTISKERKITVDELLDALIIDLKVRKCRAVRSLSQRTRNPRAAFGNRRASSIVKQDLDNYILDRRALGYAENTIAGEVGLLKQAFRLQKAIPIPDFPALPQGNVRDVLITPAQGKRLCAAFTEAHYRDFAEFAFATGWRGVEIRTLRWEHVRQDTIRLAEEYSKNKTPRDFPLVGAAAEVIARRRGTALSSCPLVFHDKGRPLDHDRYYKAWRVAACKAGLGQAKGARYRSYQGVHPHDTRRSFITTAIDSGVDPQTARTLSGHKSNAIFERYRILQAEQLARAVIRREEYVASRTDEAKVFDLGDRQKKVAQIRHDSPDEILEDQQREVVSRESR